MVKRKRLKRTKKKAYLVIEKFNLTEFDEDYGGELIKKVFGNKPSALKHSRKLRKRAEEAMQDYKYEVRAKPLH